MLHGWTGVAWVPHPWTRWVKAARLCARAACARRPTWHSSLGLGCSVSSRACASAAASGRALLRQVVVDEQGRLAGVLSRGDVLRAVINNFNIYMRSTDA